MTKDNIAQYEDDLISVIVPAFNASSTLERSLQSIKDQSYPRWEALVVDDASEDGTKELMRHLQAREPRIRTIFLAENQGAAVARNEGLKRAKGRYVAFLDADDYWDEQKLEKQLAFMRQNGYGFTYTWYTNIYENKAKADRLIKAPPYLTLSSSLKNTIIGCLTVMIDRKQIGEFYMPEIRSGQDHVTWWRILERGHMAYGLQENLASYRIGNRQTLSSNKLKTAKKRWYNYRHVMGFSWSKAAYYFSCYVYYSLRKHYF
ncbi:glycosyltransferase family 2 protein [Clostridia bacterium]|nr:glycosyltransferase family 2 protein [Clostridia bacterium]